MFCVLECVPPLGLFLYLFPILLLLLLELPEVGLDGAGCFLHFNGAERRNGRGAHPVAGAGVWAGQEAGDSQRSRGNSRTGKVCSNDWGSDTRCALKTSFKVSFFSCPRVLINVSVWFYTRCDSNPYKGIIRGDVGEHTYAFYTPLCCSSWGHQTAKRTQQPGMKSKKTKTPDTTTGMWIIPAAILSEDDHMSVEAQKSHRWSDKPLAEVRQLNTSAKTRRLHLRARVGACELKHKSPWLGLRRQGRRTGPV